MREIIEKVTQTAHDDQENIYEIVPPYGFNIYEQVDGCDRNKGHKKNRFSRRLKISLIIVSVCIGILITVLCPVFIISSKEKILITTTLTASTTTTPIEPLSDQIFQVVTFSKKTTSPTTSPLITSTVPALIYCDREKPVCREEGLTPYCNLTIVDQNGNQMKYCNNFVPVKSTATSITKTTTTMTTTMTATMTPFSTAITTKTTTMSMTTIETATTTTLSATTDVNRKSISTTTTLTPENTGTPC